MQSKNVNLSGSGNLCHNQDNVDGKMVSGPFLMSCELWYLGKKNGLKSCQTACSNSNKVAFYTDGGKFGKDFATDTKCVGPCKDGCIIIHEYSKQNKNTTNVHMHI